MGGKALLPLVPDLRTMNRTEYSKVFSEVSNKISAELGIYRGNIVSIPSYTGKDSFGDMDLIIPQDLLPEKWVESVTKALGSTATVTSENSMVTSFEYKKFQIDILVVPRAYYDFAYKYYSFNDLGNLMGRIARAMGLKLGHDGLWLRVKDEGQTLGKVLITRDWYSALELLGFNYYSYGYQFNKIDDIFKYVTNGTYFSKEIFQLENGNHRDRTRDSKRPSYTGFLEYIAKPEVKDNFNYSEGKTPWVNILKKKYPSTVAEYNKAKEQIIVNRLIKKKFNGDIIKDLTGIEGESLGKFIEEYKTSFKSRDEFEQFVLASSPKTIADSIKSFQANYVSTPTPVLKEIKKKKKSDKEEVVTLGELLAKKLDRSREEVW